MSCRRASGVNGRRRLWVLIAVSLASVPSLIGQEKGGGDETGAYQQEGNLYTAEAYHGRAEKFRPKPGADPAEVIAPERPFPLSR